MVCELLYDQADEPPALGVDASGDAFGVAVGVVEDGLNGGEALGEIGFRRNDRLDLGPPISRFAGPFGRSSS